LILKWHKNKFEVRFLQLNRSQRVQTAIIDGTLTVRYVMLLSAQCYKLKPCPHWRLAEFGDCRQNRRLSRNSAI